MVKFTLGDNPVTPGSALPYEYILQFDFNELADAERVAGVNLFAAIMRWPVLSCSEMRALLYALLKPANQQVLLTEAGGLFTKNTMAVMTAISAALKENGVVSEVEDVPAAAPAPADPALAAVEAVAAEANA